MTVGQRQHHDGRLLRSTAEEHGDVTTFQEVQGRINPDLTVGADVSSTHALQANGGMSFMGAMVGGNGFLVTPSQAIALGLGKVPCLESHIRPYLNGRDLLARARGLMAIDLFGLTEAEVRRRFPAVFQHLLVRVKPGRDINARDSIRRNWWLFSWPRPELRKALVGLRRYVVTIETAKHRPFMFVPSDVLPDHRLVCIATEDAYHLGILSSRIHVVWSLASGGRLEDRPIYNKTRCFDPFAFPAATPAQSATISNIAEELDAHRKICMSTHTHLSLTMLYNVFEKLRSGAVLSEAESDVHDAGQVSILRHLHDRLDEAVAAAYGWPVDLADGEIVARVVALNVQRRAEEAEGLVRWLRPEFQAPEETRRAATQPALGIEPTEAPGAIVWPRDDPARQFIGTPERVDPSQFAGGTQ